MAQRHRICAAIALKVKEIGFRGECGYNQLLYPIESQTRSLLTWLILRLPSAEVASRKENLGANALLNKKIAESLQDWKSQEWRHPSCSYGVPPRIAYNISPLITLDENINARSVSEIFSECGSIGTSAAATILEKHSLELICDMKATSQLESDFDIDDSFDENITSKSILNHTKSEGSILALLSGSGTSDGGFHRSSGSSHADNSVPWPADRINTAAQLPVAPSEINVEDYEVSVLREEEDNLRRVKIKFLEEKMQSQSIHLLTQKQIQEESSSKLSLLEEKAAQLTANSEVLERDILVKKKTLELIPFAAENIINLMDLCEDAKKKLYQLHQEFDTCRQPYESELYNLKFERDKRHKKCHLQLEEIKFFKEKMTFMLADMKEKEARAEALAEEVENLPDNLTRASYTHRILDIVSSLDKQTKDIDKITTDIRAIQKTLNITRSALERADTVAEELIFVSASADINDREKADTYRRLKRLRSTFNDSIETVNKIGQLDTIARDLEAKIEEEQRKVSAFNFQQINDDLTEIKLENSALILRINEANLIK